MHRIKRILGEIIKYFENHIILYMLTRTLLQILRDQHFYLVLSGVGMRINVKIYLLVIFDFHGLIPVKYICWNVSQKHFSILMPL